MVVANAMLIMIGRALNMLKSQIAAQGEAFEQTGGFSERLTTSLNSPLGQRFYVRSKFATAVASPA